MHYSTGLHQVSDFNEQFRLGLTLRFHYLFIIEMGKKNRHVHDINTTRISFPSH